VNLGCSSNADISSGVIQPSGVSPLRCSNHNGIQCASGVMAIRGCAFTIWRSKGVPECGHPTIKVIGLVKDASSTLFVLLRNEYGDLGLARHGFWMRFLLFRAADVRNCASIPAHLATLPLPPRTARRPRWAFRFFNLVDLKLWAFVSSSSVAPR